MEVQYREVESGDVSAMKLIVNLKSEHLYKRRQLENLGNLASQPSVTLHF